jgi:YD repeat-containing protein
MTDATYDPEADAVYFYVGDGKIADTREAAPNVMFDYDAEGRLVGIEVLGASRTLASGDWLKAPLPGTLGKRHAAE